MRSARRISSLFTVIALATVWTAAPAVAGVGMPVPAPVNVVQDCWTTDLEVDPDPEKELYTFTTDDSIDFIWKHKLLVPCSAYHAVFVFFNCMDGKPLAGVESPVVHSATVAFGPISPVPGIPELLFAYTMAPGTLAPGRYDWAMVNECDDTDGAVGGDGDIDDECGVNMGTISSVVPLVLGPEPIEWWDPDPGGSPPGRGPGEEGTTRPWCFEVVPADPPTP